MSLKGGYFRLAINPKAHASKPARSTRFGRWHKQQKYTPYVLDLPILIALSALFLYPLLQGIASSFFVGQQYQGLINYERLATDSYFWQALIVTLLYVVVYTVGLMLISFLIALAIDASEQTKLRGHKFLTSVLTLPYAIPDVVASLIWLWMLNPKRGVVNYLLSLIGVVGPGWLTDDRIALYSVILVSIWRLFPMNTLIILAAFRSVPTSLYEAADIDGAKATQKFFFVTLPCIANIISFLTMLTVVWSFKRFTMTWLLTEGGPMHSTETLAIKIFKEAFQRIDRNYASAIAVVLLVLVGIISVIYLWKLRSKDRGGALS